MKFKTNKLAAAIALAFMEEGTLAAGDYMSVNGSGSGNEVNIYFLCD